MILLNDVALAFSYRRSPTLLQQEDRTGVELAKQILIYQYSLISDTYRRYFTFLLLRVGDIWFKCGKIEVKYRS
jgi:hypothetical protein